ncbi:MAG: hypothetical protein ACLPKT_00735 [Methylocella sp.]
MANLRKMKGATPGTAKPVRATLADLLVSLRHETSLSPTRLRDLHSAVKRIAGLLGEELGAIPLDLQAISTKLASVNPIAASISAKTFANLRSAFLTAVKVSGLKPVQRSIKIELSPAWANMVPQLSGKRAHLGLSRFVPRAGQADRCEAIAVQLSRRC